MVRSVDGAWEMDLTQSVLFKSIISIDVYKTFELHWALNYSATRKDLLITVSSLQAISTKIRLG